MDRTSPNFMMSLLAGASAGCAVDVALYPLDCIKTRLQSEQGFIKSGGFRGIYKGIGPAIIGSAPNAATFFVTYEALKSLLGPYDYDNENRTFSTMMAAACAEITACIVRTPVEVIKQRMQTNLGSVSGLHLVRTTLQKEGITGLYRGYFSMVFREIPFSLIQFPIWEFLKTSWSRRQGYYVDSWQSSLCGALAGGISAAVTTPLDVAKTRIMLAESNSVAAKGNILTALELVYRSRGLRGLFAGITPRVTWISIGGAIFFGVYESSKHLMEDLFS